MLVKVPRHSQNNLLMKNLVPNQNRINDKTKLLIRFNYVSSLLSLVFGLICFYYLNIREVIPHVFVLYCVLNLINVAAFTKHGNLTVMAISTSLLSVASTLAITLFSGGIESPFVFILGLIVLAGYISTSMFGKIYLYIALCLLASIYLISLAEFHFFTDVVPSESRKTFSFVCILFSVYLLGGFFGKNLLKTHHDLYKSKAEIERRIQEKEVLLREVHHRVKNNMQTVSSLLNMQARNTADHQLKSIMKNSQNRIMSMAMVHEMLYMHNNISKIKFEPYVQELGKYLMKSLNTNGNPIKLNIDIPAIQLGIDTAIPLGLLINEAITNSLKYGFVETSTGQIDVWLRKEDDGSGYALSIGDNGIGFSGETTLKETNTLGLKLMRNLARQLKGSITKDLSKEGTHYAIKFQELDTQFRRVA